MPSLLNHSCAPTADIMWVDDAAFVRAAHGLDAGRSIPNPNKPPAWDRPNAVTTADNVAENHRVHIKPCHTRSIVLLLLSDLSHTMHC